MSLELGAEPLGEFALAGPEFLTEPVITQVPLGTINTGGPILTVDWGFSQAENLPQSRCRVKIVTDDLSTVLYDSGEVLQSETQFDIDWDAAELPTQSTDVTAIVEAGLTHLGVDYGGSDSDPFEIDWGDPQCTIVSPSDVWTNPNGVDVEWTFTDPGRTQSAYRVRLLAPGGLTLWDTGWVASTDTQYHVPAVLTHGSEYTVSVQLRNNHGMRSE